MADSQKRMLFAIITSFLFLMVWSKYFGPKPVQQPSQKQAVLDEKETVEKTPEPLQKQVIEEKPAQSIATEKVFVQFDALNAALNNHQGVVDHVTLHNYKQTNAKDSVGVHVVPLALEATPPMVWSWDVNHVNQTYRFDDQKVVYEWIERGENSVYRLRSNQGPLEIEKTYTFDPSTYQIHHKVLLRNTSQDRLMVSAKTKLEATRDPEKESKGGFFALFQAPKTPVRAIVDIDDEANRYTLQKISKKDFTLPQGTIDWAGFESQYFLLALRPQEALWSSLELQGDTEEKAQIQYVYAEREIKPQSSISFEVAMYAGPKDIGILTGVDETLREAIDLGSWLGPIARVILKTLRLLYNWFGNYGWAIILLTVIVRLIMFPLAQKQAKSMKKMQVHKPAMDALKEKHGENREEYSRALMEYMRTHRINPAGGCLPLLIQFPIFIALYRVLYNSIELRHAPFILWIKDLSAHDPYFVLPALVGITFFFQTKLNPTPISDPTQAAMMKFMPVMFSVLMIFLPSGLNLYIFISTLWGIVQQYWVQQSKA